MGATGNLWFKYIVVTFEVLFVLDLAMRKGGLGPKF